MKERNKIKEYIQGEGTVKVIVATHKMM